MLHMKKVLMFLELVFVFISVYSQHPIDPSFYDPGSLKVKRIFPSDTLLVSRDTLFLMNRFTFKLYNDLYNKNPEVQKTMKEGFELYENQLKLKMREYGLLKEELDLRTKEAESFKQSADRNLKAIQSELERSRQILIGANLELEKLKKSLKEQRWKSVRQKSIWCLSGVCAGILITLLVD
jgi:hypothetical protein